MKTPRRNPFPEFTREMKSTHTILFPSMLDFHFPLLKYAFEAGGYRCEILKGDKGKIQEIISAGWEYSNNDVCFPANLIIGQFITELKSKKYDLQNTALLLPQTGGGCRACNYIHLLRKALCKAGLGFIPVVSLNVSGIEKHSGFSITPKMVLTACAAIFYSDLLMVLRNAVSPYEKNKGECERLVRRWNFRTGRLFKEGKGILPTEMPVIFRQICQSFSKIERKNLTEKNGKIFITGELYIKFCSMGNFGAEEYLRSQGCEIYMGGFVNYICYLADCETNISSIYDRFSPVGVGARLLTKYLESLQRQMNKALSQYGFEQLPTYSNLKNYGERYKLLGETMGDGWLIFAEVCTALENSCNGGLIVLPFGCLVSHTCARGIIRRAKELFPKAVIYAVDFDSGISEINVKNRIKMALSFIKTNL